MKKIVLTILISLSYLPFIAQQTKTFSIDSLYREDQFYVGVTYNLLAKRPNDILQVGFSPGFHFGFIRDMPINTGRNIAIGLGLGYSSNTFNQNLLITKTSSGTLSYAVLGGGNSYIKNKFSNHLIELPLELRWRTSTPTEYNFWRIYTGFKVGYLVASKSKYEGELGLLKYKNIQDFNNLQYGLTLSAGYNTWNLYFYYGLNPIFSKNAVLNGSNMETKTINLGLMFYIL